MIADSTVLLLSLAVDGLLQYRIVCSCWNLEERSPTQCVLTMAFIFPAVLDATVTDSTIGDMPIRMCEMHTHFKRRE